MRDGRIDEAMAQARVAEDVLRGCDLTSLTSVELTALVVERETQRRRQESFDHALIAELVARGVAGEYARSTPVDLLVELLNIRPSEAKARVTRAAELGPRRDLTGAPLGPILPIVLAAVADGAIGATHADVIIKATREVPDELEAEFGELVEKTLTDYARHTHPGLLAKAAATILDRLDPDGQAPEDEEKQRRRAFGLRKNTDGTSTPYGRLTPEATGVWCSIFDALAAPQPAEDGSQDLRSADQRRHYALLDSGRRLMRSDLPHTGGATIRLPVAIGSRWLVRRRAFGWYRSQDPGVSSHNGSCARERRARWRGRRQGAWLGLARPTEERGRERIATDDDPVTAAGPDHNTPSPPRIPRLDRRRTHRHRQPHPAVRLPPPQLRGARMVLPHQGRHTPLDTTRLARSEPSAPAQHRQPHRHRLRHRIVELRVPTDQVT